MLVLVLVVVGWRVAIAMQNAESLSEFNVFRYEDGRQYRRLDSFVVERVDADLVLLGCECELAAIERLELVVAL